MSNIIDLSRVRAQQEIARPSDVSMPKKQLVSVTLAFSRRPSNSDKWEFLYSDDVPEKLRQPHMINRFVRGMSCEVEIDGEVFVYRADVVRPDDGKTPA